MKKHLSVLALSALMICGSNTAFSADNPHQEQAAKSVKVDKIVVETTNTVKGDITADKSSHVYMGDTHITNTEADKIETHMENEALSGIKATKGGTVSIGNTNVSNFKGGDIIVEKSKNTVKGKVKADGEGSLVSVGDVEINNVEAKKITINTDNTIHGKAEATGGSVVKVGTASLNNLDSKTVKFNAINDIQGDVTAKKGSIVSVGNLSTD